MRKIVIIISILCASSLLYAQDGHLSQYFHAPLFTNPANTGAFMHSSRFVVNYRQQWSAVGSPYKTFGASAELRVKSVGIGGAFYKNDAGNGGFANTHGLISLGYTRFLDTKKFSQLSVGGQVGFMQRAFYPEQLSFDNQYTSELGFDPNAFNGETFERTSVTHPDLNIGLIYRYRPSLDHGKLTLELGVSGSHIIERKENFFATDTTYFRRKITAYGNVGIRLNSRLTFEPTILFQSQGTAREIIPGIIIKSAISDKSWFHIGGMYRLNDAIIPYLAIETKSLLLGASYDINTSALKTATGGQGAWEVSLILRPTSVDGDGDGLKDSRDKCPEVKGAIESYGCPDIDGDGIIDPEDRCPQTPGIASNYGCPPNQMHKQQPVTPMTNDADKDGVLDHVDQCPTIPGPAENKGCPQGDIDADGDGIPNRIDKCADIYGLPQYNGCPDSDGDGIPDDEDRCPMIYGALEDMGCPETEADDDMDGIPNANDRCPQIYGLAMYNGCADSDGDGLADPDDKCPLIMGLKRHDGCPETNIDFDNDGMPNNLDKCPYLPGLKAYDGCPDTDGDGVADNIDRCPNTIGEFNNYGCPVFGNDHDSDGILNPNDECPYIPGLEAFAGCPDTDEDGIKDSEDNCPEIKGSPSNYGCPSDMNTEIASSYRMIAFENVEYDVDKAVIRPGYFDMLNELAQLLVSNESYGVHLSSHTDSDGTDDYNLKLSQRRSNSVRNYLILKGVNPKKIYTSEFGEIMPLMENLNAFGKQKNRRTEIIVIDE